MIHFWWIFQKKVTPLPCYNFCTIFCISNCFNPKSTLSNTSHDNILLSDCTTNNYMHRKASLYQCKYTFFHILTVKRIAILLYAHISNLTASF